MGFFMLMWVEGFRAKGFPRMWNGSYFGSSKGCKGHIGLTCTFSARLLGKTGYRCRGRWKCTTEQCSGVHPDAGSGTSLGLCESGGSPRRPRAGEAPAGRLGAWEDSGRGRCCRRRGRCRERCCCGRGRRARPAPGRVVQLAECIQKSYKKEVYFAWLEYHLTERAIQREDAEEEAKLAAREEAERAACEEAERAARAKPKSKSKGKARPKMSPHSEMPPKIKTESRSWQTLLRQRARDGI